MDFNEPKSFFKMHFNKEIPIQISVICYFYVFGGKSKKGFAKVLS